MATIPSTARLNRRYLLVKASRTHVEAALMEYLGVFGWSRAAPVFLPADNGKCILAVERKELVHARAALALAKEDIDVLRVSGTLKGLGMRGKKNER